MKKDGGPAFPVPPLPGRTDLMKYGAEGMSLRDWFAGRALSAHLVTDLVMVTDLVNKEGLAAKFCYAVADAMLAEREKE